MSLYRLEVFVCVAKHRHITRAARELRISQPSVSRHLRALEEEFGFKLYRHSNHGIELTAEGEEFLREVQSVLDTYDGLTQRFKNGAASEKAQSLRIGSTFGSVVSLLPCLITVFNRSHPKVRVVTNYGTSEELERQLLDAEIELALISRPGSIESIAYYPCGTGERVPFVSSIHPLAKKAKLTVNDLEKYPLILRTRSGKKTTRTWEQLQRLERDGIKLNMSMDIESPRTILLAVKNGLGIGFTDRDYLTDDLEAGRIKVLKFPGFMNAYELSVIYAKERPLSGPAEGFLALARQRPKSPTGYTSDLD